MGKGPKIFKLNLEDKGQDFLSFYVQGDKIIATEPFQGWLWNGRRLAVSEFAPGDSLTFADDSLTLKYRVESVEEINKKQLSKLSVNVLPVVAW